LNDQFFVCLGQFAGHAYQSLTDYGLQLTHCGLETMRRFVENYESWLIRDAAKPLDSGF
jgi:hypothetical protein